MASRKLRLHSRWKKNPQIEQDMCWRSAVGLEPVVYILTVCNKLWFNVNHVIYVSQCEYSVMIFGVCTVSGQNKSPFTAMPFLSNQSCSIFLSPRLSLADRWRRMWGAECGPHGGRWVMVLFTWKITQPSVPPAMPVNFRVCFVFGSSCQLHNYQ